MNNAIIQTSRLRLNCQGILPLDATLHPWMEAILASSELHSWLREYGAPLNLINTEPLAVNIEALNRVAHELGVDLHVFFARKANKCLSLMDAADKAGGGLDVASRQELQHVIEHGIPGENIICTAAIKDDALMQDCIQHGVTITIDNADELRQLETHSVLGLPIKIALRLSGFDYGGIRLDSRFGIDITQLSSFIRAWHETISQPWIEIVGIHFHLDGYSAGQRVAAISQCLPIVDALRDLGHSVRFLDIGGGIPMSYLEDELQWDAFWGDLHQAILGKRTPITYRNHGLGYMDVHGEVYGRRNCYPYYQKCVQAEWLRKVLSSGFADQTIADAIRQRNLQLRCEPGRSVLDGCGMTVTKVVFRKQCPSGEWFIGLNMNSTQCRTSSDDFLVDPILVPVPDVPRAEEMDGYLVGAYCTESELISLRQFRFPRGANVGDLVAIPNTAGYFMHFRESRSHQFPLAKNVVVTSFAPPSVTIDPIDL